MKQNNNIIFMGTPDFAVETLKKLHEEVHSIVAVVCPPDKPAGRGHKLKYCAVKKYALSQNLKILQPKRLKNREFLKELKTLKPELIVVVAFRMLPKEVWSIPKKGTFNIHASLLPEYRGAAPIHWAIINGESLTGVTSFLIDEDIDTGAILMSKKCKIRANETMGELHDRLMHLGAKTALETCLSLFNGKFNTENQIEKSTLKKAPKLFKENCRIDWTASSIDIHNKIRGLSPFPVAWTIIEAKNIQNNLVLKIYEASYEIFCHNRIIGDIEMTKKQLKVFTKDGCIYLKQIQPPGKKSMNIQSFLNGLGKISYEKAL
tara:strand:- start:11083 stop:12039 length:957 start_codon:yes stop_codon:yes gene_type:complete